MNSLVFRTASKGRLHRTFATLPSICRVAKYDSHGSVEAVTKVVEEKLPPIGPKQVGLRFIAAPINPADFNMIEGVYSIRPPLPAIGGNEGVAEVAEKGKDVTELKVGDWVLPCNPGFGTWRTHAVCDAEAVMQIDKGIPAEAAATIAINPCTAYRMLHDFKKLSPGDVVIQNGANSAVGLAVIQLAKHMGLKTINVVRDRPDLTQLTARLKELGADVVVTEESISTSTSSQFASQLGSPVLGLNCVGGKSASEIARLLADRCPMVTYGGMSRKPVTVPTGKLIFNDIILRGFWLSRWTAEHTKKERKEMIDEISKLIRAGKFQVSVERVPFDRFSEAINGAKEPFRNHKVLLTF